MRRVTYVRVVGRICARPVVISTPRQTQCQGRAFATMGGRQMGMSVKNAMSSAMTAQFQEFHIDAWFATQAEKCTMSKMERIQPCSE
jgi:hypothetical protein